MTNQNNGGYHSQRDKGNDPVKNNPKAGEKGDQNKKNANTSGASSQSAGKKNLSRSDSDSE